MASQTNETKQPKPSKFPCDAAASATSRLTRAGLRIRAAGTNRSPAPPRRGVPEEGGAGRSPRGDQMVGGDDGE
ncbi:hypothetical protein ABZP36_023790 [Zizania latifolia]